MAVPMTVASKARTHLPNNKGGCVMSHPLHSEASARLCNVKRPPAVTALTAKVHITFPFLAENRKPLRGGRHLLLPTNANKILT